MRRALLVTGSRSLEDWGLVKAELEAERPNIVIVGDCPTGVDAFTRVWCICQSVTCRVYKADWRKHGRAAGPLRNSEMVRRAVELGATVLAFPRGGPGTRDCIFQAKRAGLSVRES